jgi:drug/metabolite transporter (DMT)-like permease
VASFVGLTEVLFAVLFAWLLLGELPAPVQLAGGVLIIAGVVAVRVGELHDRGRGDR